MVGSGSAFNVAVGNQLNFTSDYNLFHLTGTGKTATWGSTSLSSWEEWQFATGRDTHSNQADPLFVDIDGPDNVLGNSDDDFHVQPGSPTQDAGNPLGIYSSEAASGNRVDLGAFGNTVETLASTGQRISLIEPSTYQKVQVGQPVDIRWLSSGLRSPAPVLLLDAGGSGLYDATSGRWSAESYRRGASQQGSFTQAVDVSGITNPPPTSLLQSFVQTNGNVGDLSSYDIPLADGSYQIRLFFVDPAVTVANQRKFDVTLQGQTVLSNYDIFADAGAVRKAVAKSFSFTASQGAGLSLEFINRTSGFNATALVNAFEITRVDASAPANFAVNLEFSPNNGQTWSTIATNLPSNRFGEGQFTWNSNQATQGHTGIFRVTAVGAGVTAAPTVSSRPISVAAPTNSFYVNLAGDNDFTDNEYTTVAGNDLNTGTLPSSPLPSISALLKNYDLGPGDTIYVDSGTYNLQENLVITAIQSGVRIQGPVIGSHAAIINRGNTTAGNFAVQLIDATNVTIDSVELIGAMEGLRIDGTSHDFTLTNSVARNNVIGIHVAPNADRAIIMQNELFGNIGTFSNEPALLIEGDNARIEDNVIRNNSVNAITIQSLALNAIVRNNDIFGNLREGVFVSGPGALIERNTIHGNSSDLFSQGTVQVSGSSAVVQDNLIFGNGKVGIRVGATDVIVQRNVIHDNTDGIESSSVGVISDNRIYRNSLSGVRLVGSSNQVLSGNTIYANPTGVVVTSNFFVGPSTIINNVIYDSDVVGIDIGTTPTTGASPLKVHNNTIFGASATAIRVTQSSVVDARNNILSTATGNLFNVANAAQVGFTSDYNLLHVTSSGNVGLWGADTIQSLSDWFYEVGRDEHSIASDPQFIDIDGLDGRRGYDAATSTDFGADDNFREQVGSPVVDAGDPLSYYLQEPVSGNRINIGAYGNLPEATESAPSSIQFVAPPGLAKFEVGQAVPIQWISSGSTTLSPIALINAGGGATFDSEKGRWGADAYQTGGSTRTVNGAINTSLLTSPPPLSVLQTFSQGPAVGSIRYDLPVPDGQYNIRLFFVEPTANGANQRKFDIVLQGQTALANYDIFADTGAVRKATSKSFALTSTQGRGLQLELISRTSTAIISGIEITKVNPSSSTLTTNLEFSPDNGGTWSTIATNLPVNRFGEGSFTWNATTTTNGNVGLFRATAVSNGLPSVNDLSGPFSIANSGNAYFINIAADASVLDNEYTSASGNDANSGKDPNSPMKSLSALIRAYDLDPSDTIFVDSGTYKLQTSVSFGPEDSGVKIQGPAQTGHRAGLNRANTSAGSYGLEFLENVNGVIVERLEIFGAEDGVHITNANNIEVRNSIMRNNSNSGVYVETTGTNIQLLNNQFQENTASGIEIRGTQILIEDNLIRNSTRGVHVTCCNAGDVTIRDNDIFGHNVGVDLASVATGINLVQGNTIHDNASRGINANISGTASGQILDNEVYGHSGANDVGIFTSAPANARLTVSANRSHHNFIGLNISGSGAVVQQNQVFSNNSVGIQVTSTSAPVIESNQVFSNATGFLVDPGSVNSTPQIRNNLVYSNANVGIDVLVGTPVMVGNTIVHPVGNAVRFTGNSSGTFRNNIVVTNIGTLLSVATGGQTAFVSDRNDLFATSAAANVGLWGSTPAASLANWQTTSGRDANSISADPLFLDIDGADNVLGEQGVPEGNGFDDNFGLRANSPVIDRGDTLSASQVDLLGRPRQDDLGTTNTGTSRYVESSLGSNQFAATGVAQNFRANDSFFTVNFPGGFTFPFYGTNFTSVFVSTNGLLQFGVNTNANDASNTISEFLLQKRIAPLWDDLTTALAGDDIFVDTSVAGSVTIRWNASRIGDNSDVQFSVKLISTGEIQFHYGPGNSNLTPTVGISAGDGVNFLLAQYDGQANLASVPSIGFSLIPGIVDLGAYEFQGTSTDITPPTITGVQPAGIFANGSSPSVDSIVVSFSEPIDVISANSPGLYQLIGDGPDQQFDTGDDVAVGITNFGYTPGATNLTLTLNQLLSADRYRLTILGRPGQSIFDSAGNRLDGDADGNPGVDFVRTFLVNNAVGLIVDSDTAANQVTEVATAGTLVGTTAFAFDPDVGSTITYSLVDSAEGRFEISPTTGVVRVASGPGFNAEASISHNITVRATSNDGSFSTVNFVITVIDVDEFDVITPIDVNPGQNAVNENAPNGTLVGVTIFASDEDATTNAISYSLVDSAGGRFAIDTVSGVIFIANGTGLNREVSSSHNITAKATSADGSVSIQTFTVQINDVDEFDVSVPVDVNSADNSVSENAINGDTVGITVFSNDADATLNAIVYELIDSAGGRFSIDAVSGVVKVANSSLLNSGTASSHFIRVRATSSDGSSAERDWIVSIAPNHAPTGIQLSQNSVFENTSTAAADLLFGQLAAVDPDPNESHTFALVSGSGDSDNTRFRIVGNQIFVKQGVLLDFEAQSTFNVRVRVTDVKGATFEQTIALTILNVPEVVGSPKIGNGTAQRSLVKSLTIEFDGPIAFQSGAFQVRRRGASGGNVGLIVQSTTGSNGQTIVNLTFSGPFTRNGALLDGNYELILHGASITGWVGNDYTFGDKVADKFFAFYGDTDGNRSVNAAEFGQFRATFGRTSNDVGYNPLFDYDGIINGLGVVDILDFGQLRSRFGKTLGFE